MGLKFWKTVLQLLAGVTVSALLLFLLAEGIRKSAGEIRLEDLAAVVKSIPLWVLGFALFCQLSQVSLRMLRYSILLDWDSLRHLPKRWWRLLAVTVLRSMFVDMLPSRSGELAYVWLVKRILRSNIANGFSSLGAAFVFDLIALLTIVLIVTGLALIVSAAVPPVAFILTLFAIVGFAVIGFFFIFPYFMDRTAAWRMYRFRMGILGRFHGFLENACECILQIRARGKLLRLLVYSLLIRIFKYGGTVTMLYVILETSFGDVGLSNVGSLFLGIVAGEASASLPIPSFMSFGTYEVGASLTLSGLGFSLQAAAISIFIVHLFSQLIDYTLGGITLFVSWLLGWFDKEFKESVPAQAAMKRCVLGLVFCVLLVISTFAIFRFGFQQKSEEGPVSSGSLQSYLDEPDGLDGNRDYSKSDPMNEKIADKLEEDFPSGFAVWSSNRFGNHEIVKFDFKTKKLEKLTNSSEKEFYVSISPSGQYLVYAREREPNRSYKDLKGWDVVLHDLKSGQTNVLASNSFHPSWAGSDTQIVYTRNGDEVVLHELSTSKQTVLIKAGKNGIPSGYRFKTPYYNPEDEALAVTIRGSRRTKFVYSMKEGVAPLELPEGCQLSWMPDNEKMVFTNHGHVGDNAFQIVDPNTSEVVTLLDLPTEYHHIYFPRFSENGKWLIYGASKGDHEHDQADYDIFLWRVGSPIESIQQLASDPANDSWPDLHLPE